MSKRSASCNFRTVMCWNSDTCDKVYCTFAHDENELRKLNDACSCLTCNEHVPKKNRYVVENKQVETVLIKHAVNLTNDNTSLIQENKTLTNKIFSLKKENTALKTKHDTDEKLISEYKKKCVDLMDDIQNKQDLISVLNNDLTTILNENEELNKKYLLIEKKITLLLKIFSK